MSAMQHLDCAWRDGCDERVDEKLMRICTVVPIYEDRAATDVTQLLKLCLHVFKCRVGSFIIIALLEFLLLQASTLGLVLIELQNRPGLFDIEERASVLLQISSVQAGLLYVRGKSIFGVVERLVSGTIHLVILPRSSEVFSF